MKKSSIIALFVIFVLPLALYYFFKLPVDNGISVANAGSSRASVMQFSSKMCHDCKKIEGEIAPLRNAPEYKHIYFQKIDVSSRSPQVNQLIGQYGVDVVPTLIFKDKNGTTQCRIQGYVPQSRLRECLNKIK